MLVTIYNRKINLSPKLQMRDRLIPHECRAQTCIHVYVWLQRLQLLRP